MGIGLSKCGRCARWQAYIEDLLPQGGGLHAADEPKQQVHHGGGVDVLQHQADEAVLLPQEGDHLGGGETRLVRSFAEMDEKGIQTSRLTRTRVPSICPREQ